MSSGAVRALAQVLVVVGAAGCLVPTPQEPETAAVELGSEPGSSEVGSSEVEARSDAGPAEASPEVAAATPQEPDEAASQSATAQVSVPEVEPGSVSPPEPDVPPLVLPDPAPEDVVAGGVVAGTAASEPPELDGGSPPSEAANPAVTVAEMPAESAGPDAVAQLREEPGDPAARAVREVRDVVNRYYEAYGARDWYKANQEFWPTATVTSLMPQKDGMPQDGGPLGVVVLPADEYFSLISHKSTATGTTGVARLAEEPQLQAAGILAQVWCHYGGRYGEEEDVMKWHRFDAFTLLLHDNTWKIAALVVGPKSDRGPKPDSP